MTETLDINVLDAISATFQRGRSIRRNLPMNSKLVIDQKLPYICVYRFQTHPDPYISSLAKTQGAYLIANASLDITPLLQTLVKGGVKSFNSFMIIEVWNEDKESEEKSICLLYPEGKVPATIEALEEGLKGFKSFFPDLRIFLEDTLQRHPRAFPPLLPLDYFKETGALLIGIQMHSLFSHTIEEAHFPFFFRRVRRKFAEVLKLAAFEFARIQTDNTFENYLMLGKTRLDNLVRSADRKLAAISENIDFLLRVTPVNTTSAWEQFQDDNCSKIPKFSYRLITIDPEIEKRKLFSIPIEKIEHPTLAFLLRDKRMELEKQLIMLEERGTKRFLHTSQSMYGEIDENLKTTARQLLTDEIPNDQSEYETVNAEEFAKVATAELDKYRQNFPQLNLKVKVKSDVTGLIVSGSELSVGKDLNISELRVNALIQHEIGTHILTYCNGHLQPLKLMYAGFAGYDEVQEGLAVLSEFLVGELNINRLKLLAARVLAVDSVIHGADFIETYNMLCNEYGFRSKTSFNVTARVHRGGGFTKDAIYLKGLIGLLKFIRKGGDIFHLYPGKFALSHLPYIEELMHLRIIKKPLLPDFLSTTETKERIARIRNGIELKELIN